MCRQGRQCWQLTEGCLHHGDAELVLEQTLARFFSLSCLDHQTPGLKGRTSCSNIGCCRLCREIKQEGTSSWQFKDFRFRCREWKKKNKQTFHTITQHEQEEKHLPWRDIGRSLRGSLTVWECNSLSTNPWNERQFCRSVFKTIQLQGVQRCAGSFWGQLSARPVFREHWHFKNQLQFIQRKQPYSTHRETTWKSTAEANTSSYALRTMLHLSQLRSWDWRHKEWL